ncbi:MAG: T9SS type A sorting domain-containing protein [Ignavibacteria bacterium]
MKKSIFLLLVTVMFTVMFVHTSYAQITKTVGTTGSDYTTLKAAFDAINAGTLTGSVTLQIIANTTEASSAILNASGSGSANYSSVLIYPTSSGLTISGSMASGTPMIDLNGADNVTFDGRVNQSGSRDLIITNTSTGATVGTSTIRLYNDASSNTITYCIIKSASTASSSGGAILIYSASTTGNINNNVTYCELTKDAAGTPSNLFSSNGTTAKENVVTVSNNNLHDFTGSAINSNFTKNSTFSGNSIYQTASVTVSANIIGINIVGSNNGNVINGNYIGGTAPSCGGASPFTTTSTSTAFYGIWLDVGTTTATKVYNNTIANISVTISSSATAFTGIYCVTGNMDVGTDGGNTIGSGSGTGSILINTTGTPSIAVMGIDSRSTGTVNIQNNTIGSINTNNVTATTAIDIHGIRTSGSNGIYTVTNNNIGSTSTSNSITSGKSGTTTTSACNFYGISNGTSPGSVSTITLSGNTIQNCTAYGTGSLQVNGIQSFSASTTVNIFSNTINTISSTGNSCNIYGVYLSAGTTVNIYSNTISAVSGSGATSPTSNGVYVNGGTTVNVYKNNIYNLSESGSIITTAGAVNGILMNGGTTVNTYNNFISELTTPSASLTDAIRGISETNSSAGTTYRVYNNTVYLNASSTGTNFGTTGIYHIVNTTATNGTLDLRNNIIANNSTPKGTGYTVAFRRSGGASSNLANYASTSNYNNFYAGTPGTSTLIYSDGTGSAQTISQYKAGVFTAGTISPRDANSVSELPPFVNVSSSPYDLSISTGTQTLCEGRGSVISTPAITTDYFNTARYPNVGYPANPSYIPTAPDIGAHEFGGIPFGLSGTVEVGTGKTYTSLTNANGLFDFINNYGITGNLTANITSDINTESGTVSLNQWSGTNTLTISPSGGAARTVSGGVAGPMITLNGADRVTFDGLNTGGNSLIISNTNTTTSAATIKFINDASGNTLNKCTIKGATTSTAGGVIFFSTGTTTGNITNTISNCDITKDAAGTPTYLLYSNGTSAKENTATISNNNFYDFGRIALWAYTNSKSWTINGNSFYQTASVTTTVNMEMIRVEGNGYSIYGNYLGGNTSTCGGTAFTINSAGATTLNGISVYGTSTPASTIYNNTIQNINITTVSTLNAFVGIQADSGDVNIGTDGANTIGSSTGTGSITVNANLSGASAASMGIYIPTGITNRTTGTKNISNNIIGSINVGNTFTTSGSGHKFYGIFALGSGAISILNNKIGSTTTANSINATNSQSAGATSDAQFVRGIDCETTGAAVITGNTIANMNNSWLASTLSQAGINFGIYVYNPSSANVSNNTIYSISTAQPMYYSGLYYSITGIYFNSISTTAASSVSGNTIYDLRNTSSTQATKVMGIYYYGNTAGTNNKVENNLIHSLYTASNTSVQYGMYIGNGYAIFRNNIIRLGIDKDGNAITSSAQINGFQAAAFPSAGSAFKFNTVYIGGTGVTAGAVKTYAFNKSGGAEDTLKNNIFVNVRQNAVATRQHYSTYYSTIPQVSDYNVYYYSATDGQLDNNSSTMQIFRVNQIAKINDLHSAIGDPKLITPTGSAATLDLNISTSSGTTPVEGTGVLCDNVSTDYAGNTRSTLTPTDMGAYAGNYNTETTADDIFTPVISYTTFTNFGISTVTLPNFATITDQISGVNTTSGTKPRLYYKKSTDANAFVGNTSANNGWKYVEATNDVSPFSFVIDHSILNGGVPAATTTIQYYVVAQDLATTPNVMFWPLAGSVGASVGTTGMTAPTTLNSYTINSVVTATAASNRITTGFRANWTAFTGAAGYYLDIATDIAFTSYVAGYQNLDVGNVILKDVTGLSNNMHYYYRLRAYNSTGTTGNSNIINASTLYGTAPTTQATNITFSDFTGVGYKVNYTRGNGDKCIVFAKATASNSPSPVDGTYYTANSSYGSGTQIGSTGWYCVYRGTGSSFTVSGMTNGVTYRIKVIEFNGNDSCEAYNITDATGNPADQSIDNSALSGTKYIMAVGGDYATFTNAVTALNIRGVGAGGVTFLFGDASYPNETFPVTINQITGVSSSNRITFKPAPGVTSTLSGSVNGSMINYNGADYINFDGCNTASLKKYENGNKSDVSKINNLNSNKSDLNKKTNEPKDGNNKNKDININPASTDGVKDAGTKNLTITNTNTGTSASTIKFYNDASYNNFENCTIKGSSTNTAGGVIFFSTGTTTGNINDTVIYCDLRNDDAGKPLNLIYSDGTSTKENSNMLISNNNFYNYGTANSSAINIVSNSNTWTISGNSIYQTDAYTGTAGTMYAISIYAGNGHTISGNYIGGSTSLCGGSAWTVSGTAATHTFTGIYLSVGTTTATSVQGNTIQNFNWLTNNSSGRSWAGIYVYSGVTNIGNITGNTIGSETGNGSITFLSQASGSTIYGIFSYSTYSTNISNNKIGSFTVSPSAYGVSLQGIRVELSTTGGSSWTFTVNGNLVGSLATANSIYLNTGASGTQSQGFTGITCYSYGTLAHTSSISNNTVANVNNNSTSTNASATGLYFGDFGNSTVSDNTIRDITSNSTGTGNSQISGINMVNTGSSRTVNIFRNNIYNLYGTNTGNYSVKITGINNALIYGTCNIYQNRIYNLVSSLTSSGSGIYGINTLYAGNTSYYNNQISLGKNTGNAVKVFGFYIYAINVYPYASYVYYNSVYISGTGTGISACFAKELGSISGPNAYLKNNILFNGRTGSSGYIIYSNDNTSSNIGFSPGYSNYNLLVTPSSNYVGYWNASNKTYADWKTATGHDANSWDTTAAGITAANLFTDPDNGNLNINTANQECWFVKGKGIPLTGYADDYSSTGVRSVLVSTGATDIGTNAITTSTNPFNAIVSGSHTNGGTETFSFAGRTLATITWGATGTLPTVNYVRYHVGRNPGNPTGNYSNAYWEVNATGGSGYTYSVTYYYDANMIYKIGTETNIRLAKSEDNSVWIPVTSTVNTSSRTVTATGLNSFSYFGLSDVNAPLPVLLASFKSLLNGRNVTLNWMTEQEINNAGFEVERTGNRQQGTGNWEKVGFVKGQGNTNTPTNYTFEDKKLSVGKYQYRLKQIDNNGNFEYHELAGEVEVGLPTKYEISQNYPNPFNPMTKIDYQLPVNSRVTIVLYDLTGKEVAVLLNNEFKEANFYTIEFNANKLSSGTYFYRIVADKYVATKKMVLVK